MGREVPWRRQWPQLQSSCLENPMDRGASLVGYSPWGRKESDRTEAPEHACTLQPFRFLILLPGACNF